MPIRDKLTGKPLSGAALRARRAARAQEQAQGQTPTPAPSKPRKAPGKAAGAKPAPPAEGYAGLTPPPVAEGYHAALAWAQGLAARGAAMARSGADPVRVAAVGGVLTALAKLRGVALDSETAVANLASYFSERVEVLGGAPPAEAVGRGIWAWWQMCRLAFETATGDTLDVSQVQHAAKSLAVVGLLNPVRALDELAERIRRAGSV